MKISYQRTGGFAGMVMKFDLATETLSQEEVEELQDLMDIADFFSLPDVILSDTPGTDRFHYRLTVQGDELKHTVEVGDNAVPENLWPLLNKIRVLSRTGRDQ